MPTSLQVLRILVSSPGDVSEERECVRQVVEELNAVWGDFIGLRLELIMWETHTHPAAGQDSQSVINGQLGDDYDIFVGIMWKRFGTPTGRYESGTEEEYRRAYARHCIDDTSVSIMFYFKDAGGSLNSLDLDQYSKVRRFRDDIRDKVLYREFENCHHFEQLIRIHLSSEAQQWRARLGITNGLKFDQDNLVAEMDKGVLPKQITELFHRVIYYSQMLKNGKAEIDAAYNSAIKIGSALGVLVCFLENIVSEGADSYIKEPHTIENALMVIGGRIGSELLAFSNAVEPDIEVFRSSFSHGIRICTNVLCLFDQEDLSSEIRNQMKKLAVPIVEMSKGLSESHALLSNFRTVIANIPPISSEVLTEKARATYDIDEFLKELFIARDVIDQLKATLTYLS